MSGPSISKCPFCDNDELDVDYDNDTQKWRVICNCGGSWPAHEDRHSCIELWNNRPEELAMLINSADADERKRQDFLGAGLVIVPREPTEAMIDAGVTESDETPDNYAPELEIKLVYEAMINAALKEQAR